LNIKTIASLGLSATPERPYDNGLLEVLVPLLGEVIYEYNYKDALKDKVIVPFELRNIVFELDKETENKYNKITRLIAQYIQKYGIEDSKTITLYIKRSRILNMSINRVLLALKIVAKYKNNRILIFHEDIKACNAIDSVLKENGIKSGTYHSKMKLKEKALILKKYRSGEINILVTCRSLDEGFNVPETEIGIIAASTATKRQRIQRLGRILRPTNTKNRAIIYTLIATQPELTRLQDEERNLEGVAKVIWTKA
jgi:superfamily II DNA or RNA helicase